ncbi:MAG: hypothetical protein WAM44_10080 [Chthoniobacterales bacterium]
MTEHVASQIVLVLVVVLETVGTLIRRVFAQDPEGSRFAMYLMTSRYLFQRFSWRENIATGGSRERPTGWQLYR